MPQDQKKIISGAICPYCHCETKLVEGDVIYPNLVNELPRPKFLDKYYYQCTQNRDHYVGTYADNITSLGRLADVELRKHKNQGHQSFDPLWKEKIHLPLELTHFGMFTKEQCQQVIGFCEELKRSIK